MAADRQILLVRGPGDRTVDVREPAAARLVPGPNLRRRVIGRVRLLEAPDGWRQRGLPPGERQAALFHRSAARDGGTLESRAVPRQSRGIAATWSRCRIRAYIFTALSRL
jgi:hypothetical protein